MPKDQVRAAYNRAQYLEERRRMMQSWADYLDGLKAGAQVIPIKKPGLIQYHISNYQSSNLTHPPVP
jgi:hypothetical protein